MNAPKKGATMRERHNETRAFVKQRRTYLQWQLIAARDAPMTIYHFGTALAALRRQVGRYPTLCAVVDTDKLKKAHGTFSHNFPRAERIRHAIGHTAETRDSMEEANKHKISGISASCSLGKNQALWMTFKARTPQRQSSYQS
jgi:hypothetical protein